jgi:hypothetical protein
MMNPVELDGVAPPAPAASPLVVGAGAIIKTPQTRSAKIDGGEISTNPASQGVWVEQFAVPVGDHDPEGHATPLISIVMFTDPITVESGATALIISS